MPTIQLACGFSLALTLLAPGLAHAEPASNAQRIADAKASPSFRKVVKRAGLKKAGLETVQVAPGITMDVRRYVRETGLDAQPMLKPLLDPKLRHEHLTAAPSYAEEILVLDDRLVVDRRLTVPLAPGACAKPALPAEIANLCFVKNPANKPSKAVAKELKDIRAKLAKADAAQFVIGKVTVGEAAKLDDEQLLDLLLNGGGRTIHHVSIVPRAPLAPGGKGSVGGADTKLGSAASETGLAEVAPEISKPGKGGLELPDSKSFATEYFLTGFTYGRELEDSWEYTIADSTWLTDRYYIRLGYHLGLGFGVRAPFSVAVKSAGGSTSRQVELAVAPVDVDSSGNPAYPAVGLPQNKYFDGKEFVLELTAGCDLYVSVPGPNLDKHCPSIDKGWSRDIDPVIGNESSTIADWWLDGAATGLALSFAIANASLDLGLGADVTKGRVGLSLTGLGGAGFSGITAGPTLFDSREPRTFGMTRAAGSSGAKLRLEQPRYGFDIRLRPKLRGRIGIDVAIYEHQWIIGPFALDFLAVSQSFMLGRHDGTVAEHDYAVFEGSAPGDVLDPNIGGATPPKPPKGKGPKGGALPPSADKLQ